MKKHTQSPYESSKVSYKPSGIKWLGEIPQSWKNVSIRSCFTESNQRCNTDSYPLLSVTIANGIIYQDDIENKKDISNDDKSNYKIVPLNAVAYNKMRMWQGAVGVNTLTTGIVSPAYIVAIPNEKILPNFVSYLFKSKIMISEFDKNSYGLCLDMNNLRYDDFRNIKIPLPPLQEQKEIAEFLDKKCEKIQNYIDKKQKLITLLQEKKQALINEAVCGRVACHTADSHCHTEPLGEVSNPTCHTERSEVSHNTESKRDFSHSLKMTKEKQLSMTTAYKPSGIEYLGLIPHHWEAVKVKFTAYVKGRIGFHGLNSNEFRYDEGAYLVTGNDFDNNEVMWDKCRRVSEERFYEDPNIHLQNNDLLITKDGTIGKTAIVNNCPKQATLNSGIFLVRTMKKMCFVKYLFFIINSQYFKEFVNVKTSGSTIKHLYQSDFHDLKIPLPPLQEQKQIANFLDEKCEKINSAIEKTKRQIELIKEYKNTLINEAVCGRIRVN
ncbi:restriction endonuclease subunit S [Campylobacter upsaliensis]|nr:restriction endonuclease subunit S [Campylobacter upsaliensis]EAK2207942.1 restriction endonuclease subunit S [Campylobacter upsaliensis]EAK3328444.1 restriction endonuclease subunit S [Campylobacter upsaliensis]EAL3926747.1 restriction endonuclease subunit S [Campylobacter upsaliensis]EDP6903370.1 restriction endonuclease subunit S [Campylobacter upsaliensis]